MATSTTMMALGEYVFSISTAAYQDLQRTHEFRWPSIDRIGVVPASQFIGPGEETISLSGTIYPHFVAQQRGLEQMALMRAEAGKGLPLILIDGGGRIYGSYVITSITEKQAVFFSDGAPRKIEFSLELKAYGLAQKGQG